MNNNQFASLLDSITNILSSLTPAQREQIEKRLSEKNKQLAVDKILSPLFENNRQCPHCNSIHIWKWGGAARSQRYKCKACSKTFNNKTNTSFHRMRFPEKWLDYARCMENKLTLRQCVAECDISLDTAFHWRHKFLDTESKVVENKVSGIVEVDEFFMAYSEKGSRCLSLNRAPKKRGGSDRRLQENQVPVLLSIDRNRHIVDAVLKRDTALEIQKAFIPHLEKYSVLCSDGSNTYVAIAHKKECDHKQLNSNKNRVLEKVYHIQNVNGAIAHFRGWVEDKMRGVATKYLSHYLAWFRMGYCKCGHVDMIKRAYASPQPT